MKPEMLDRLINDAEAAEKQRNGRQPLEPDCWSGGWPCGLGHHTGDAALSVPAPWSIEAVLTQVEIRHLIVTELRGTAAADPSFARKRLDAERALQPWTDAAAMWAQRHDYALGVAIMLPFLRGRIEGRPPASLAGGLSVYAAELGDDYDDSFDDGGDLDDDGEDLDDDGEDLDDDGEDLGDDQSEDYVIDNTPVRLFRKG